MNPLLKQSILDAPIIHKGEYPYIIHPLCDGFPFISPHLLTEVIYEIEKQLKPHLPFDRIVTVESMGIPLATVLSQKMNIPFTIIRKRRYDLPTEHCVHQETGYSTSELFINGITPNESIIIVDDILSTGGTLQAVINALQSIPVTINAGIVVFDKGEHREEIARKTSVPIHALATIRIQNGTVIIL